VDMLRPRATTKLAATKRDPRGASSASGAIKIAVATVESQVGWLVPSKGGHRESTTTASA
jgi:hypothetical protein